MKSSSNRKSHPRVFKVIGSVFFTLAGLAYIFIPPMSQIHTFDGRWVAVTYGAIFALGGAVSLVALTIRYTQLERFGVFVVVVAALVLTGVQLLVMFEAPITWGRAGNTLIFAGLALWALDRWHNTFDDTKAIIEATELER